MAHGSKKKSRFFEVPLQDMVLRIAADPELYEDARVAGLSFWEQLQSYSIRDHQFRTSKRPVDVPESAPAIIREMAGAAARAGVGPIYTFQGAIIDHVGRHLAKRLPEVMVSSGGDYFVVARKRQKLSVPTFAEGQSLAVVVRPDLGPHGIFTTAGRVQRHTDAADGLVVVASSCMLADAAAAGANVLVNRTGSLARALDYL